MTVVVLNGERLELHGHATVAAAVELAGAPEGGQWATTELREGQELEVLHAVQGGS